MATLTIRNVPDELVERLKDQAARNRRSLNQEVISQLIERKRVAEPTPEELLRRIVHRREEMPAINSTPEELTTAIGRGRL